MEIDGRRRRAHADDRVAVARDPGADLLEKRDLDLGQRTIAGGTDVQEQVAAARYDVGEIARQQVWRFVVGVLRPPTPRSRSWSGTAPRRALAAWLGATARGCRSRPG